MRNGLAGDGTTHGGLQPPTLREALADAAGAPDPGSHHLVNSKLQPPLPVAACVDRKALLVRIDAALRHRLLLLAAPIGSGKTTLLTQWHRRACAQRAVAWLTLDELDNEPVRFFSHLIGAIRSAIGGFDAYIASRRDEEKALPLDPITAVLSESLRRVEQDLVVIIDDFQWLTTPALTRAVDFLLQHSPDNVHWIIASRGLPSLNMSQLRLNDQLMTLGAADLSFDSCLIVELSRKLCRRPLSVPDAESIRERTEGWVAGAKLALLAAEDPKVAGDALRQFAGSHCEVARYLGASVLQEQSEQMREFLLASSIVDRMTGELCDALLGISHSQSFLEQLERSQLFIEPLDSHSHWYRYHTLFRDFLRSCLRRDAAASLSDLHERASRWFAEHQMHEEALQHAFAAKNDEWRGELVSRCVGAWLQSGEIGEVLRWCGKLSHSEMLMHPGICIAYIASLILCRRFDAAMVALREVESCTVTGRAMGAVHLRLLHMMLAILSDNGTQISFADHEALRDAGADGFLSGTLLTLQAYAMLRRNQFDIARRLAMRARDAIEHINVYGYGYADVVASLADRAQGDMKSAAERCERTFAMVRNGRRNPAWVNAATALAYVRYEENRLGEAEALCMEVLPLLSVASTIENFTTAYITLARIKIVNQRSSEASQLLDYLHSVLEGGGHRRFVAQVCNEKIRLHLAHGNRQRAWSIAAELGLQQLADGGEWREPRTYDEAWERLGSSQALLLMQRKEYDAAHEILAVLRDSAHAAGYLYREAPLEAALAECYWRAGDAQAAFEAVNRGWSLTHGYGFSRSVFDETPALTQILAAALERRKLRSSLSTRYFEKFHSVFGDRSPAAALPALQRKSALPLEPLTDREIDMLRLLARGLSNQAISEHSRIALSTAKWHLKNVFAKLDVSTRTGAIARARELQLID